MPYVFKSPMCCLNGFVLEKLCFQTREEEIRVWTKVPERRIGGDDKS